MGQGAAGSKADEMNDSSLLSLGRRRGLREIAQIPSEGRTVPPAGAADYVVAKLLSFYPDVNTGSRPLIGRFWMNLWATAIVTEERRVWRRVDGDSVSDREYPGLYQVF